MHCVCTPLGFAAKVSAGVVSAEASSAFGTGPKPERHYAPASKGPCNRLDLVGGATPHAGPYCESQHNTRHLTPNQKLHIARLVSEQFGFNWTNNALQLYVRVPFELSRRQALVEIPI